MVPNLSHVSRNTQYMSVHGNSILVEILSLLLADIYAGNETNSMQQQQSLYDPLSPNIYIQILLTLLHTVP